MNFLVSSRFGRTGLQNALTVILAFGVCLVGQAKDSFATREAVGQIGTNRWYTPANQILTPAGLQVELPGMRPQALALSPNGKLLVTSGKTHELVVIDPVTGRVLQNVPLPSDSDKDPAPDAGTDRILEPDKEGQLSFTGLIFSADGSRIYLSNVRGSVKVFGVQPNGKVIGLFSISLPESDAPGRKAEIPAGLALSKDGKKLYVALNLSNRLIELEAANGNVLRTWNVGFAPYDVVIAGQKIYVSNWGGRRPETNSLTGPAGKGTLVRVDPVRHIASEGSVSVIDLENRGIATKTLTPALSLSERERENRSPSQKKTDTGESSTRAGEKLNNQSLSPLPVGRGEGQGEGQ